jgi:hypothetical protein
MNATEATVRSMERGSVSLSEWHNDEEQRYEQRECKERGGKMNREDIVLVYMSALSRRYRCNGGYAHENGAVIFYRGGDDAVWKLRFKKARSPRRKYRTPTRKAAAR